MLGTPAARGREDKGIAITGSATRVLEERLDRLERENRRLRRSGLLVLAGLAAVDCVGKPRATMTPVSGGGLALADRDGKVVWTAP